MDPADPPMTMTPGCSTRGLLETDGDMDLSPDGRLIRKAGIMSVVVAGGTVRPGDAVRVRLPDGPRRALEPV